MIYAIRQKMVAFGDDFSVRDQSQREVYFVDGKAFSFGADLSVLDQKRKQVARIRQHLFALLPTFSIRQPGAPTATVRKKWLTMRPQFTVIRPGQDPILVIGNFILYDYIFYRGKDEIARVSKRIISFTDSYGVQVNDSEDQVLILSAAIVIDMILHSKQRKRKK